MNFSKNDIDLFFSLVYITKHHAGVAKLVIALACHAGDHGFEPRHSRKPSGVFWKAFLFINKFLSVK